VAVGDQVKQGAAIGQLDTFQVEQDLNSAKYEADRTDVLLRQFQKKLASYDSQIENDNYLLARNTELRDQLWQLFKLKAPTPADHARAIGEYEGYLNADTEVRRLTTELNTLKTDKQITALDDDLYQKTLLYQQKRFADLQGRLASAQLVAPINGLILSLDKQVGNTVQVYESIGAIADPTQLQIEVSIPEANIAAVSLGQTARIVLDGFPDKNFTGKVKEIASKASIFQGTRVYRVVIAFDNLAQVPATLRMGADVSLIRQGKTNVLLVPSKAIQQDGATQFVSVLRGDKWERAEVRVGVSGGTQTEILSGVVEGDQVLVP
jgi:RND family efflux transporter MFP subunit